MLQEPAACCLGVQVKLLLLVIRENSDCKALPGISLPQRCAAYQDQVEEGALVFLSEMQNPVCACVGG